jgi:hypothetical protein
MDKVLIDRRHSATELFVFEEVSYTMKLGRRALPLNMLIIY